MAVVTKSIDEAIKKLSEGELVALPTETVYGLAGNGLSVSTVASIFEAKKRPFFDPLILHCASPEAIENFVTSIDTVSRQLIKRFMPGPLTLLLPKRVLVPDLVTAGSSLVAVRVPAHPMIRQVLVCLDFPLAAPSANPFGYISPTRAQHVQKQLGDRIGLILDGGPSQVGIESTIVQSTPDGVWVHRYGALSVEEIAEAIPGVHVMKAPKPSLAIPGQQSSHYAPVKKLHLFEDKRSLQLAMDKLDDSMALVWGKPLESTQGKRQLLLSEKEDLAEGAGNLFTMLHQMDESAYSHLFTMKVPDEGLGTAINDRLLRASAR